VEGAILDYVLTNNIFVVLAVGIVSFPMLVCGYVLFRLESTIKGMTSLLTSINTKLERGERI
jgi:hypothetical protein